MDGPHPTSIPAQDLYRSIGTAVAPVVVDVRRSLAFAADDRMIVGAIRRNPDEVRDWCQGGLPPRRAVVVYCVHGHETSQGVISALRKAGVEARYLEHGIAGWAEQRLPMRTKRDAEPRRWVTRERPKIDRIACPWLIRRFIDSDAEFLFAPTERVFAVAAEIRATPYDIPGAEPFSRDGEFCSFDAFLKFYGIENLALDALALIVRGADTARLELTPQSPGLLAVSLGLSAIYADARMRHDSLRRALRPVPRLSRPRTRLESRGHDHGKGVTMAAPETSAPYLPQRSFREIVAYFLRLGTLGFGGPVALCGLMEKELVTEKGWLTKEEMRDAIAVSQSLPGPLAIQVGIFIAYLRGGFWGAWAGGSAFILPNFLIVAVLGALYVHFGGLGWMTAIFYGVSPAVIALIIHSCYRLAKLGMEDRLQWVIAAACFVVTIWLEAEVAAPSAVTHRWPPPLPGPSSASLRRAVRRVSVRRPGRPAPTATAVSRVFWSSRATGRSRLHA